MACPKLWFTEFSGKKERVTRQTKTKKTKIRGRNLWNDRVNRTRDELNGYINFLGLPQQNATNQIDWTSYLLTVLETRCPGSRYQPVWFFWYFFLAYSSVFFSHLFFFFLWLKRNISLCITSSSTSVSVWISFFYQGASQILHHFNLVSQNNHCWGSWG